MSGVETALAIIGLIVVSVFALWFVGWMTGKIIWIVPRGKKTYFRTFTDSTSVIVSVFGFKLGSNASIGIIRHKVTKDEPREKVDPTIKEAKQ